jgi:EAL domain-containing protein (putative c-di-GMP-specific phosphodiesterase class I)/CheY-like chemotaxis protein
MDGSLASANALVIDDDEFTRKTTLRVLAKLGVLSAYEAASGIAALRCLADVPSIDLIVCDLSMPEIDGIETLRRLSDVNPSATIVLASAADPRILRSAKEMAGRFGLNSICALSKPITVAKLREALSGVTAQRSSQRQDASAVITGEEFRRGLLAREFIAHYQPKVDFATRKLVGAEALVRWQHPILGLLSPGAFLPVAEQIGLLDELTDIVLAMAIAQCASWKRDGLAIAVSVNLPLTSLSSRELPARIESIVAAHDIDPSQLIVEVTEDGWLQKDTTAREVLTRLRLRGYGLSIDDYGTGYSTVQQLLHAPFNELKIDQSFVQNALVDNESAVVLSSSISMAHQLNLKVVAEGIETEGQWDMLAGLGCDIAQGYFIARPLPGDRLIAWDSKWEAG